jgi:hypothetical protein
MTARTTLNWRQAEAVAELVKNHVGLQEDATLDVENEYSVGGGNMILVAQPSDKGMGTAQRWLVGRDGGVIAL